MSERTSRRTSSTPFRPRWFIGSVPMDSEPQGKVQLDRSLDPRSRDPLNTLPEGLLRLAQEEYDRRFPGQPYERMQERGGLGLLEVVMLLADHVDRLKHAADQPLDPSEV